MDHNNTQVVSPWFSLYGALKKCSLQVFYWEITIITFFIFHMLLNQNNIRIHCLRGNIMNTIFFILDVFISTKLWWTNGLSQTLHSFLLQFVWSFKKWIMNITIFCVNYMKFTLYFTDARYSPPVTTAHTKKRGRCHKNWIDLDS